MEISGKCFNTHIGLTAEALEEMLAEGIVQPETISNLQTRLDSIRKFAEIDAAEALRDVLALNEVSS